MMANAGSMTSPACLPCSQPRVRASPVLRQSRCAARRSADEPQTERRLDAVKLALSGLAAAALLHAPTADAGVVIEKSGGKKLFQGGVAKPKPIPETPNASQGGGGFSFPSLPSVSLPSVSLPSLPGLPSAPSVSPPSFSLAPSDTDFDPLKFALPAAIAGIAGLGFLFAKLDTGFSDFFREAIVKDSGGFAGYEEADVLKGPREAAASLLPNLPNPFANNEEPVNGAKKAGKSLKKGGTQALKRGQKGAQKASKGGGGFFGLGKK